MTLYNNYYIMNSFTNSALFVLATFKQTTNKIYRLIHDARLTSNDKNVVKHECLS